jgi:hypothetical protein
MGFLSFFVVGRAISRDADEAYRHPSIIGRATAE